MKQSRLFAFAALGVLTLAAAGLVAAQAPTNEERIAALKQSLATGSTLIKQYEWVETTVMIMKGEEKSNVQNRCYYGADGKIQKTPLAAPAEDAKKKKGIRGKVVENKTEEISGYMKNAVGLVKSYVPPDPAKIQAAKDAGKVAVTPAGSAVKIDIRDYEKPGDTLGLELDMAKNTLTGLSVASWLKDAKDTVGLKVAFTTLPDGALYASQITLSAPTQKIEVKITNSGYKKL